jgi:(p)ppGpp synthase/HD superfamily hydrolase
MIYTFYDDKLLAKAMDFSRKAHARQTYTVKGDYYDAHIKKVVYQLLIHHESYLAQVVGALHDIYEDTPVSREEIVKLFGNEVDELVWELTKQNDETYFDYIRRVKQTELCKVVKLEDASCNYRASVISGSTSLIQRYAHAMLILLGYA